MRMRSCSAIALALLTVGCLHYQPRPISPADSAAAFAARSLRDPGLADFLTANHEPVPAPGAPWGLRALTLAAFYFQPALDVARADLAAARAGRTTAAQRENPAVAPSVGYDTTTPVRTISPWILGFNLDIPLRTAGKRQHLMAAAAAVADASRFNLASVAWGVRSAVRAALVQLWAATRSEDLLARQEGILAENAKLLDAQLAAGEVSPFDATQAHLALTSARLARQDAAARREAASAQLASAVGVSVGAIADLPIDFADIEETNAKVPEVAARREALLNRADVLGALAEYDASQAVLAFEIARQYPDLHLGPGYEYDQGDKKWFLALSLPLPIVNRNRGPIADAEAGREAAAARFEAIQANAMSQIDRAVQAYEAARRSVATATAIGVDLSHQEKAAQARFQAGEISRLELGSLRLELVTAELARLDAKVRAEIALGQLEDAMQRSAEPLEWAEKAPARHELPRSGGAGQ
jgi:cobalt-zinc-cadmium efflux system outer membrane protein